MQETQVCSLIREDPTCHKQLSLCDPTTEPVPLSLCSTTREATAVRGPCTTTREKPTQQQRPSRAKNTVSQSNKVKVLVAQSCPTLRNPVNYSPPGSSVHGISQARILEWVAISFSRGSSQAGDQTRVSHIAGRYLQSE